jgi:NitT/TauT family transport system substrate-binding protein
MEDYIKAKPDVTRNFVQATMEGVSFTLANPAESIAILKKHQPQLDEDTALKEVEILRKLISSESSNKQLGSMMREKMAATQDLMVKYLDLGKQLPLDEVFTNEFLA